MEISTKNYHIWDLVLKLNSRLRFLPPFTGGKKCLEFPLCFFYYCCFCKVLSFIFGQIWSRRGIRIPLSKALHFFLIFLLQCSFIRCTPPHPQHHSGLRTKPHSCTTITSVMFTLVHEVYSKSFLFRQWHSRRQNLRMNWKLVTVNNKVF